MHGGVENSLWMARYTPSQSSSGGAGWKGEESAHIYAWLVNTIGCSLLSCKCNWALLVSLFLTHTCSLSFYSNAAAWQALISSLPSQSQLYSSTMKPEAGGKFLSLPSLWVYFFFFLVLAVITALIKCRSFFPLITGWSGRRMGEERLAIAGCSDVLQAQQEICSSSICWQCRGVLYHLSLDVLKGWIISQHHLQHSSFNSPTVLYWRNTGYNNGICLWMCLFFFFG